MRIYLEQGSQEWLDFRMDKIGATDYCVIHRDYLMKNDKSLTQPFKTRNQLLTEKVYGSEFKENQYTRMGKLLEPVVHEWFCNNTLQCQADEVEQQVIFAKDRCMASLDALITEGMYAVVEYKTTSKSIEHFDELVEYYKYQVAHQMFVSGSRYGYLVIAFVENQTILDYRYAFFILDDFDKNLWQQLCDEFISNLDEYKEKTDISYVLGNELEELEKQQEELEQKIADKKQEIISKALLKAGNYKISYYKRYSTYDHKQACIDAGITEFDPDYKLAAKQHELDLSKYAVGEPTNVANFKLKRI